MAAATLIVTVTILKSTRVVSLASFSTPAVFGPSNRFGDPYRIYNSASAMLIDGFLSSDPEYIEVNAMFSQPIKPVQVVVSKFSAAVAQVDTFQVGVLATGHLYQFTLNSVIISYTSSGGDTQQSILASLLTAIGVAFPSSPPVSGSVVGTGAGATLTLTSTVAGLGVSYSAVDADLTHVNTIVSHSIAQDIATAQVAVLPSQMFYGVIVTSHAAADILQVALYVESQLMVYVTATLDAGCLTNSSTDIMSSLKSKSLNRTMILYSAECNTAGPDGAWMGYMLPTQPGIGNWAMKTLVGVDADNLNPTQVANVLGKSGNVYVIIGGNGTTLYGTTPSGEYFDVTIFLDWLASTIQAGIITVVTDPLNLKVPYSNAGIGMIENPIHEALQTGQDNLGLLPGWTVFAPNATSVPKADRAGRVLNKIGFNGQLAGAINKVNVQGFVTV